MSGARGGVTGGAPGVCASDTTLMRRRPSRERLAAAALKDSGQAVRGGSLQGTFLPGVRRADTLLQRHYRGEVLA